MRTRLATLVALCGFCAAPGSAGALGIGISTPSVTLAGLAPGQTASGSGTVTVTGVPAPWTLKVADPAHAGHLRPGAVGCSGSEAQTVNPLSVSAGGLLPTTNSSGTVVVGASPVTVATGSAADTVTASYSLVVGPTEVMGAGCVFSTTVTFTVQ